LNWRSRWLAAADRTGRALENAVLVTVLSAMILLAAGQIFLRNLFDIGFIWTDELLRMLVLWIALAGAVAASREDKQINIAVLDRFLPDTLAALSKIMVHAFNGIHMITVMCCWARYPHGPCSWCYPWVSHS